MTALVESVALLQGWVSLAWSITSSHAASFGPQSALQNLGSLPLCSLLWSRLCCGTYLATQRSSLWPQFVWCGMCSEICLVTQAACALMLLNVVQVVLRKLCGADPDGRRHCIKLLRTFEYRGHLCLAFEAMVCTAYYVHVAASGSSCAAASRLHLCYCITPHSCLPIACVK